MQPAPGTPPTIHRENCASGRPEQLYKMCDVCAYVATVPMWVPSRVRVPCRRRRSAAVRPQGAHQSPTSNRHRQPRRLRACHRCAEETDVHAACTGCVPRHALRPLQQQCSSSSCGLCRVACTCTVVRTGGCDRCACVAGIAAARQATAAKHRGFPTPAKGPPMVDAESDACYKLRTAAQRLASKQRAPVVVPTPLPDGAPKPCAASSSLFTPAAVAATKCSSAECCLCLTQTAMTTSGLAPCHSGYGERSLHLVRRFEMRCERCASGAALA